MRQKCFPPFYVPIDGFTLAQNYTATINPGLEKVLQKEIRNFGAKKVQLFNGGVTFKTTSEKLYTILQKCRGASAIRWNVDNFKATDIREFFRKLERSNWEDLLKKGTVVSINAVTHKSRLHDLRDIEKAAKDAMTKMGYTIAKKGQDSVVILVRFVDDRANISIDIGGAAFYKRGWRTHAGRAPLRETIAASLLNIVKFDSDWDGLSLHDPMCGSGTFLIESALMALGRSPRVGRSYGIEKTGKFDEEKWQAIAKAPDLVLNETLDFLGSDIDENVIRYAMGNAQRAGVDQCRFVARSLEESCLNQNSKWIITNPPYGARLKKMAFIDPLRAKIKEGSRVFLLLPRDYASVGRSIARFRNGGLPVAFVELEL